MATTIPQVPKYTGDRADRTDPVNFPANAESEATYFTTTLPDDLNVTIDAMNEVASDLGLPTVLPPFTATEGQTEFNIGADLKSIQVNRAGSIEQTNQWSYSATSGVLTVVTPASKDERFEFTANVVNSSQQDNTKLETAAISLAVLSSQISNLVASQDITGLQAVFFPENEITYDTTGASGVITSIPGTFVDDGKLELNGVTFQMRKRHTLVETEVYVEQFAFAQVLDDIADWRPILQAACDSIAVSGKRTALKAGRSQYLLGSLNTDDKTGTLLDGKKIGIWVKRPDLVSFRFGRSEIKVDSSSPAMAAIDDVISLYPDGPTYESAGLYWEQLHVHGGVWVSEADEPKFDVRADYTAMRYCYFEDCEFRYASDTNFKLCGFAITMINPDARFASKRNYEFTTDALNGDSATRTSITLITPTADYAGLAGYRFSGGVGQTYLSLVNPKADHIGRDRANNTIIANIPFSAGYDFAAIFNMDVVSMGCEFSTRLIKANGVRGLNISSIYGNDIGSTDPLNPVESAILIEGNSGKISVKNFNWSNEQNILKKIKVNVTSGAPFTLDKDGTILDSEIDWVNFSTIKNSPVTDISHMYKEGATSLGGGVVVYGNPIAGRTSENWIDQSTYMNEFDFLMTRGSSADNVLNILTVDDTSRLGQLSVHVAVKISKTSGSTSVAPATYEGGCTIYNNSKAQTALSLTSGPSSYGTLSLQFATNTLSLFNDEDFSVAWVKVQVIGRPSTETMTYKFEV